MTNEEKLNEIRKIVKQAYYTDIKDLTFNELDDYVSDLCYMLKKIDDIISEERYWT